MAKSGNYYYELLNKEQQKAYYAMKEGLLADVTSIHRMTIDRQVERGKKNEID